MATGNAEPLPFSGFLAGPAERFPRRLQNRAHARIGKIPQAKFERIELRYARQRIHMRLACEVICRRCQPAVGTAAQNQRHLVIFGLLIRNIIGRFNRRHTGMVVVKIPGGQLAIASDAAFHLNDTRGTEVGPGKFLLARPHDLHRPSGSACQTRRFNRRITGMFPAVGRTCVPNDDTNLAFRDVQSSGEFVAVSKRPLCSRPYRQLAIGPLRHGRARLERGMRDVSHGVGRIQPVSCACESVFYGAFLSPKPVL